MLSLGDPMKKTVYKKLIQAIDNSNVVELVYKGLVYVVEPYLIWEGKNIYVHSYKVSGGGLTTSEPHWCNLIIDEITQVKIAGNYTAPLVGYNPNSSMFPYVIHQWKGK